MKGEEFLKQMDRIDDGLIQSAANANGKGKRIVLVGFVAALLAALTVAAVAVGIAMTGKTNAPLPPETEIETNAETEEQTDEKETAQTAETVPESDNLKSVTDIPGAVLYEGRVKMSGGTTDTFAKYCDPKSMSEIIISNNNYPLVYGTIENLKSVTIKSDYQKSVETAWVLSTFDFVVDRVDFGDIVGDRIKIFSINRVNSSGELCYDPYNTFNVNLFDGKKAAFLLENVESFKIFYYDVNANDNTEDITVKIRTFDDIDFSEYASYHAGVQFSKNGEIYLKLLEYLR